MFIRKKSLSGGKVAFQICENYRDLGRVKQRVLRHVGTAETKDKEALTKMLETSAFLQRELEQAREKETLAQAPNIPFVQPDAQEPVLPPIMPENHPPDEPLDEIKENWVDTNKLVEESRVVEGIHAVFGTVLDKFGLQSLLGARHYDVLRHLMMARIAWPSSKLRASDNLLKRFNTDISEDRMYRLMDAIEGHETSIQKIVFNAFRPLIGEKVEVLFFDVTTLYFESMEEDDLRRYGFSKDQKTHLTQVVLALATTQDGLPVGYKLFPGNTAETTTLLQAISEWRSSLDIGQITIVADRAMMNEKNLRLLEESGLKYVIAAKLKLLPKEMQNMILKRAEERVLVHDKEDDGISVQEHAYNDRRLIVSYSTKRARKDARDREQILVKLGKKIGRNGSTKKLVTNRGYLSVVTESGNSKVRIDEAKVAAAAKWDGLHGVITNIADARQEEVLGLYRRLWMIEESFRINKHTLEMRPVYHYVSRRIRAHILLCYLGFALCRYAQKRIGMQCETYSVDRIRSILIEVQYSVLRHEDIGSKYHLPSKMSPEARQIYGVFGLKRVRRMTKVV